MNAIWCDGKHQPTKQKRNQAKTPKQLNKPRQKEEKKIRNSPTVVKGAYVALCTAPSALGKHEI